MQSALESARPLLDAFRHDFVLELPDGPMWVEADSGRLAQIVANLVNNAAKYTNEGGHIRVKVQLEGQEAVLRVQDDGIGITADMLPKIFDLFTQVDTSQVCARGGLGVGLSLVKKLVQLHNGTVSVRSAGTGHGSEFVVRLPIGVDWPNASEAKPLPDSPSTRHLRMLIVDDNVDTAEGLAILLRLNGHEIRTAYDGPSALALAAEYAPEVILQDIGLPGMNGYEMARRLRQHPATARSLLVAVSGYGQADDMSRSQAAGFDHHLVKPVDFDELGSLFASVGEVVA